MKAYRCPVCKRVWDYRPLSHNCTEIEFTEVELTPQQFCTSNGHDLREIRKEGDVKQYGRSEATSEVSSDYVYYEGYWAVMQCFRCKEESRKYIERRLG
ncbi:MAG: hypothetical protein Q7S32_01710 [bacterium]|nr:hypothetical protein [bacterium]